VVYNVAKSTNRIIVRNRIRHLIFIACFTPQVRLGPQKFSLGPRSVFFNHFAAAEPYTSVKVTHGTSCALIRESSDVCEDEAIGCLMTFP